ncbi:hypothetical protein FA95DRAFT_1544005 [Auriscalpium vulgare]|uniref:Uncharacterized protein n=1 Tax=Auriscalpium vulgare TaxID=40419 RepID=A0ACB8RNH0_9AGAM|nr:hypothetical protein FA95DRAFT_1544005 [Auriscalpium vulgare]
MWASLLWSLLLFAACGSGAASSGQSARRDATWDTPDPDTTDHLIFNSVNSVLLRWPNTIFRNGMRHAIIPATIPTGTVLYHGRANASIPTSPEWLAFDFEHSYLFSFGPSGHVLTFMATRDLRLAYFDGSSAAKLDDGVMDTQDLLAFGEPRTGFFDRERLIALCEWGKQFDLDGFVRMEFHFEVMLCDFSKGLKLVNRLSVLPMEQRDRSQDVRRPQSPDLTQIPQQVLDRPSPPPPGRPPRRPGPRRPFPDAPVPSGWVGSLLHRETSHIQALAAGSWHNRAPGETRVHIDFSRFFTLYDPSFASLVVARRGVPRMQHRVANISKADAGRALAGLNEAFARAPGGSGVDWASVARVVVERYAQRLELLKFLLEDVALANVTARAAAVRTQLLTMLVPYISVNDMPPADSVSDEKSWAAPILDRCSTTQTAQIPADALTPQESLIRDAVHGTLHEICRSLTLMWADVFDVEVQESTERKREVIAGLKKDINALMGWLDWSVWIKCSPGCPVDQLCYVPTWPFMIDDDPSDFTPRCISLRDVPERRRH